MRIGLEVSPLAINSTGIPNYIRRLLGGFAAAGGGHDYFLYSNRPIPDDIRLPSNFHFRLVSRPCRRFQLWFQLALPSRLGKDRVDLFHGLFSRLPLALPVPGVITAHDLSGYRMPGMHKKWTHLTNLLYPLYIRRASMIVAVSQFTADELERNFPESSDRIRVVHEAAPDDYCRVTDPSELQRIRNRYSLPERFLLFLGTLEPRKNLPRLLKAFSSVAHLIPHSLVIAGGAGWGSGEFARTLEDSAAPDRVVLTGFVDAADVPGLISLADFFVYPSLYEGFGLPILEAMACGTPVMTSDVSSMPEVAGSAALLIDPLSVESIGKGLVEMATNRDLTDTLRARGLQRESEFSWEEAALKTLGVYEELLGMGTE